MIEGSSMLLDILGVVIAFSAVMLLLSLVVTALVQASQATFRLRARNLQRGLAAVVERELGLKPGNESRRFAADLLNSPEIAVLRRRDDPNSLLNRIRGPLVSWLEPETLRKALQPSRSGSEGSAPPGADPLPKNTDIESTVARFRDLDRFMRKRFGVAMRTISLCWAVIVAVILQVSAPELLKQLSTDLQFRMRVAQPTLIFGCLEDQFKRFSIDRIETCAIYGAVRKHNLEQFALFDWILLKVQKIGLVCGRFACWLRRT